MAVNFHISKDGNLVTIRHIKNSFELPSPDPNNKLFLPRYQEDFNTTTYQLTASNPSGNNIKIVGPDGRVIINSIAFTSLKTGSGNANIGASAAATVSSLNGTTFFGAGSVDDDISSNTSGHTNNNSTIQSNLTKISALENSVKTTSGDRGVYITNAKDETSSKVKLTTTAAILQAGQKTKLTAEETSPGTLTFDVAAGASGSEIATTALILSGDTTGATTAAFTASTFSIVGNTTTRPGGIKLFEATGQGSNSIEIKAPSSVTANTLLNLPDGSGTSGQVLTTSGDTGSGITNLTWTTLSSFDGAFSSLSGKPTTLAGYGITDALASLAGDSSPQLGADLDVNGNKITSASNGDIVIDPAGTGAILLKSDNIKLEGAGTVTMSSLKFYEATALDGNYVAFKAPLSIASDVTWELPGADGTANQVIKTNGSGVLSFTTVVSATNPAIEGTMTFSSIASFDPTITTNTNKPLKFAPNGSGDVIFMGNSTRGSGRLVLNCEENTHGITVQGPPHSAGASYTLTLPNDTGSNGQFLKTNGSGALSWATGGSSGGGMTETPMVAMSGRASFSATDEEERVLIGTSYGWSFYSQLQEMGDWSSSDTIDSTTHSLNAYIRMQAALMMPSDSKKVRMKVTYRVQNGNNGDFGFSIWSGPVDNDSTASSNVTFRGASATQTVGTSSITAYKKEFTTTSAITDDAVFAVIEHRGGDLSSTCYVYYNIHLFLVD